MTTRQADRIIKAGEVVRLYFPRYREEWEGVIVSRNRWSIRTADGRVFDRSECVIVTARKDPA